MSFKGELEGTCIPGCRGEAATAVRGREAAAGSQAQPVPRGTPKVRERQRDLLHFLGQKTKESQKKEVSRLGGVTRPTVGGTGERQADSGQGRGHLPKSGFLLAAARHCSLPLMKVKLWARIQGCGHSGLGRRGDAEMGTPRREGELGQAGC